MVIILHETLVLTDDVELCAKAIFEEVKKTFKSEFTIHSLINNLAEYYKFPRSLQMCAMSSIRARLLECHALEPMKTKTLPLPTVLRNMVAPQAIGSDVPSYVE